MKTVPLPNGREVPALGQGTWNIGEDPAARATEVAALRLGLDLGLTLIDTAEMYAEGGAEEVVGEAIQGRRDEAYIVSKVYPHNADAKKMQAACERSLRRLGIDCIDLYLLHWRGSVPLEDTLDGFERLIKQGKIAAFGVSNFDAEDMEELADLPGGAAVATNQVLYNLRKRGAAYDLLPWCRQRGIPLMAYSPPESSGSERARFLAHPALQAVAARHAASAAQVALAWLLHQDGVIAIPKAAHDAHVRENRLAADIVLDAADLAALDRAFPPPTRKHPLAMR